MTAESSPACIPPLTMRSSASAPLQAAAILPREVVSVLHERGLTGGSVLLLKDGSPRRRALLEAPQFQLTTGGVDEAAALLGARPFSAVVVVSAETGARELHSPLLRVAAQVAPDTLLVLHLASYPGGNREEMHLLLLRCGYDRVWIHAHHRTLCCSARRAAGNSRSRTCSIIVPVFNESRTFPELMRTLLAKRLDHLGLEREIIVVESNSTDGTREQVASFAATPGVTILWEDQPRGKGHAVRAGMRRASGDIVLIQDADLEYDLDDYDALLEPLLHERAAFVLGSRHSGRVRMRRLPEQRVLGTLLDAAHVLFTAFINVLYGQRLRDPFTMFKVFRRDCLYGLQFECNRFDFDHELLIKLLLKGYQPLEVPVRYCSRSFKQGKKIRLFRDPPTWIAADVRYRLRRLRPRFE